MKKSADRKSLFLGWEGPECDNFANCRPYSEHISKIT